MAPPPDRSGEQSPLVPLFEGLDKPRIIGQWRGEDHGPLLICTGGLHGNEPAGVRALERVFHRLNALQAADPSFTIRGHLVGITGNREALRRGQRFIHQDMNRLWTRKHLQRIATKPPLMLHEDEREVLGLYSTMQDLLAGPPDRTVVLLDLHTTTADGGCFTIATRDPESVRLAAALPAPVVLGLLEGIEGTIMHYFRRDTLDRDLFSLAFEAGGHTDPISADRAEAAVLACMQALEMMDAEQMAPGYDRVLSDYSQGLPQITELISVHRVADESAFRLLPGFENFQALHQGQLIGYDQEGALTAPEDCLMLMPRYQSQGDDGYFLLRVLV